MNNLTQSSATPRILLSEKGPRGWRSVTTIAGLFVLSLFLLLVTASCGGGGGGTVVPAVVPAPGAPTSFAIAPTASGVLSETLTWSPPATGGTPSNYNVYRSSSVGATFNPANLIITIPAVAGKTSYTFVDDAGLTRNVLTYWVVSAQNAGGETPTGEQSATPTGSTGGTTTSFGNNLSGGLIFADDIGLTGSAIPPTTVWSSSVASAVASSAYTGLRPLSGEVIPVTDLPYLDPTTVYVLNSINYYPQQSSSTWQAEWRLGKASPQYVVAKWGDNLVSQSLSSTSSIRIEMGLTETVITPLTAHTMVSLYGTKVNEIQGTDGTTYLNYISPVFAANAHLTIQKVGQPTPLVDQTLWLGDGPGFLAPEINVSGNFTYGFIWNLKSVAVPYSKTGTWRITFSLDPTSPKGTPNNTYIDAATNGVWDSPIQVHIDVNVQ